MSESTGRIDALRGGRSSRTGRSLARGSCRPMRTGSRLVVELGSEVRACLEMMSGAIWVRDRLGGAGWQIEVADARKVNNVAPLACKTDKVDARVLAELCRRELVPALWLPSLEERALRERLKRRLHLVRLRTSAKNPVFGLLTQWGAQDPARSPAPTRRDGAARDTRCARGLAPLRGRGARSDRAARRADRSARLRAGAARPRRPARLLAVGWGLAPVEGFWRWLVGRGSGRALHRCVRPSRARSWPPGVRVGLSVRGR
jgi:hypothetical protein